MTKLLTFYGNTFAQTKDFPIDIIDTALEDSSVNGIYLCLPEYIKEGYLGYHQQSGILTWYNILGDGNFLYGSGLVRNVSNPLFNNKPSIDFNITGTSALRYNNVISVGTIILVYYIKASGSYIIYSPKSTPGSPPVYYDGFPSGLTTLWANERLNNSAVFNATSRINSKIVSSTSFVPLNSARILSLKDIANSNESETIYGYGGQSGALGGGERIEGTFNSFKGSLAAVITFSNNIDTTLLNRIETLLGQYYISYTGADIISTPSFKYLIA